MKIVICPDSFKGSATSSEAGEYILKAVKEVFPSAKVTKLLMADGGEGTVEAISQGAFPTYHNAVVTGPFGDEVAVAYPITHEVTAILEMASASGITLSSRREPLIASSKGFGQLIKAAYEAGAKKIIVGIGGSATNDGGMGMLEGMGALFYDKDKKILKGCGENLALIEEIDLSEIPYGLRNIPIGVICDVTNPLLGNNGATAIYGPQKGVTNELFSLLEAGMTQDRKSVV